MKPVIAITFDAVSSGPTLTAAQRRRIDSGLYSGPSGTQVFGGYRGGAVSIAGSAVTIAPLTFVVQGAVAATQGAFRGAFVAGDTELAKTLSPSHATLTRFDALDVVVYDHEADASGLRGADIIYTAGVASGSPAAPTVAGTTVRLGYVNVPPAAGVATFVPAVGGRYTSVGGARPGATAGDLEIYHPDDAVWRRVYETVPAHFSGGYNPGTPSSIANNVWTPVPTTTVNSNSRVVLVGGNSLRIDEAGLYQCNGQTRLQGGTATGTGLRVRWTVNNVEVRQYPYPPTATDISLPLSCQLRLNAADVVKFEVLQDQGTARLFLLSVVWNFIDIARIG